MLKVGVDAKESKQALYRVQLKSTCEELLFRVGKFQDSFPVIVAVVKWEGKKNQIALEGGDKCFQEVTNWQ